jgi:hypothetical protein
MDAVYDKNDTTKGILHAWVDEMYPMADRAPISDLETAVYLGSAYLNRKQVKHIIERRKESGKSIEELKHHAC